MKNYKYHNTLISKKELKKLLSWCFSNYGAVQASLLADELKSLGFRFATQAGISISIEDLKIPSVKFSLLKKAEKEITVTDALCLKGERTEVERFQKVIATWTNTSESLKDEVVSYFKQYDPLNSVYIMAFSGARGNLSQVRQLVGMRGLMSDPSGEIIDLPIKKNFREGLTITDYLMSGYGARKGIVDTALKTANSGYLTRRLIDVAHDIIIREKDCLTPHSILFNSKNKILPKTFFDRIIGRLVNKPIYDLEQGQLIADVNQQLTPNLIKTLKQKNIQTIFIRSPLTCKLNRSICQKCYGWNLASENLVDLGEAVGIIAGQSIGEPGTQLTMRTFHTGGIFTGDANQQIISPINGFIQFSSSLKTRSVRTNSGENVLVTENAGVLFIVPLEENGKTVQVQLGNDTFLYKMENEKIEKGTIIGQIMPTSKQTKLETKTISSNFSGEIYLLNQNNSTSIDKFLWIVEGALYNVPFNSFFNIYKDSVINRNCFIFRTKLINQRPGFLRLLSNTVDLSQQIVEIVSHFRNCQNSEIKQLTTEIDNCNYLLDLNNQKYLIRLENTYSNFSEQKYATLITNKFLTDTGGIPYINNKTPNKLLSTVKTKQDLRYKKTIIWLSEETYLLNRDRRLLLIENNAFIPENFEIVPNVFSKTAGILEIVEKNNLIKEARVKSGKLTELVTPKRSKRQERIQEIHNQVFYPGETIIDDKIEIKSLSLCELHEISGTSKLQLLIRPITLYEIPIEQSLKKTFGIPLPKDTLFKVNNRLKNSYQFTEKIKTFKPVSLISQSLNLSLLNSKKHTEKTEISLISNRQQRNCLQFIVSEKFYMSHYNSVNLKYLNIDLLLIVKNHQFLNAYTTFGYLETITKKYLKVKQLKSQVDESKKTKQILLITSNDCLTIKKEKPNLEVFKIGKLLKETNNSLIIQKGRPYFFPNCETLSFKKEKKEEREKDIKTTKSIFKVNKLFFKHKQYYDYTSEYLNFYKDDEFNLKSLLYLYKVLDKNLDYKITYQNFNILSEENNQTRRQKLENKTLKPSSTICLGLNLSRNCLLQDKQVSQTQTNFNNSVNYFSNRFYLTRNDYKLTNNSENFELKINNLILKEQDNLVRTETNTVYGENGEFIKSGTLLGLLNFEKEITGDIVQGLPRIEQLLEARKGEKVESWKAKIIMCQSRLDPSFEFRKLGTKYLPDDKTNPHILLNLYFKYYRKKKTKVFSKEIKYQPILNLYDATYRSFKKVQDLILNSVQGVYKSQGVTIADKHLEIIIKQMTSKVKIFEEGHTPLLPLEVIDLHQVNYINQTIMKNNRKIKLHNNANELHQPALYRPILFGITKAALNNPSFISAASFQDTTRVLTKAAIEGQIDWLRGLKENVIIGNLIPAGTGYMKLSKVFKEKR